MIKFVVIACFLIFSYSTLTIVKPPTTAFQNNVIPYKYANFGDILYDKKIPFKLVSLDNDLCEVGDTLHVTQSVYFLTTQSPNCSYVKKAKTAQDLGAKGIIIATPLYQYFDIIIPSSDPNGQKVHISVLFVNIQIYSSLKQIGSDIQVIANFPVPKSKKVKLNFYLSASGRQNYIFLRDFTPYYQKIKKKVNLSLTYYTFECQWCSKMDCISQNKICTFDNEQYQVGSYIVKEQFRQIRILKKYGEYAWFSYMNNFDRYCSNNWINSQQCSKKTLAKIGYNYDQLDLISYDQTAEQWRKQATKIGYITIPEVSVNHNIYFGSLEPEGLYNYICQSLIDGCNQTDVIPQNPPSLSVTVLVISLTISIVLLIIIFVYLYKKCIKKQLTKSMSSKVNELVARYASKVSQHNKKRKQKMKESLVEQI